MDKAKFRHFLRYRSGSLCLTAILITSFSHSVGFFSPYFYGSSILAIVATFSIDAGMVAMALQKERLEESGKTTGLLTLVISIMLFVMGVANLAEGFRSKYGMDLTISGLESLDRLSAIMLFCSTVVFPILAYIIVDTVQDMIKVNPVNVDDTIMADQTLHNIYNVPVNQNSSTSGVGDFHKYHVDFNSPLTNRELHIYNQCKRYTHTMTRHKGKPKFTQIANLEKCSKQYIEQVYKKAVKCGMPSIG